jgi:hypothetical protein
VLQATWPAIVALLLAALGVYSTDTAVDVALALNAVILFLWGLALARLEGASTRLAVAAARSRARWGSCSWRSRCWCTEARRALDARKCAFTLT